MNRERDSKIPEMLLKYERETLSRLAEQQRIAITQAQRPDQGRRLACPVAGIFEPVPRSSTNRESRRIRPTLIGRKSTTSLVPSRARGPSKGLRPRKPPLLSFR